MPPFLFGTKAKECKKFCQSKTLKGLFTDFTRRAEEYGLLERFYYFSVSVPAMVGFLVSRIGPFPLLLVDQFGPIPDTIKSTVTATGLKKKGKG